MKWILVVFYLHGGILAIPMDNETACHLAATRLMDNNRNIQTQCITQD